MRSATSSKVVRVWELPEPLRRGDAFIYHAGCVAGPGIVGRSALTMYRLALLDNNGLWRARRDRLRCALQRRFPSTALVCRHWSISLGIANDRTAALLLGFVVQLLPSWIGVSRNALHVVGCIPLIPGGFTTKAVSGIVRGHGTKP
jgi:hypothetical protein